jgi:FixJ family two-component response regulator
MSNTNTLTATSACVGGRYVERNAAHPSRPAPAPAAAADVAARGTGFELLSARERQVLELYMQHGMAKLVACDLRIRLKTVEAHLRAVRRKAGIKRMVPLALTYDRLHRAPAGADHT